ncbi:MAG: GNAT family N-acetyltransferase [Oscillospiraceae bacterium]|nr:GNAT family N-acetyltransferase [Oscillospiraceae bacterium]
MTYTVRPMNTEEYHLLDDFLYEAIFVPEGVSPPPRDITSRPELKVYTDGFGSRKGDTAVAAEYGGMVVGAAWARIMDDYGHIDDYTPSLAISLYKEHRGHGAGTAMMQALLGILKSAGYSSVSLAVQKANYALRMYRKAGFKVIGENDEEYIMVCDV